MAFTTPIIYRPANEADRKEFIEWLEQIGYRVCQSVKRGWGDSLVTRIDKVSCGVFTEACNELNSRYNCDSNLTLAKALSALRDDSDYMQWFITKANQGWVNLEVQIPKGSFELCLTHDRYNGKNPRVCSSVVPARKATKDELIQHFKE